MTQSATPRADQSSFVADLLIIGAGAAGLMTAIRAARANPGLRILVSDGARKLGAKAQIIHIAQ